MSVENTMDFDTQIAELEHRLPGLVAAMIKARDGIISAIAEHMNQWFEKTVEETVRRNAAHTKNLAPDRLSSMKRDVQALQDRAREIAVEVCSDPALWWHESRSMQSYYGNGYQIPNEFARLLARAGGELGPVLLKYGFLSEKVEQFWRELPRAQYVKTVTHFYPREIVGSERITAAIVAYGKLGSDALQTEHQIEKLKAAKSAAEAGDLWRKA
jgi:hypothetical protein